MCLVLMAVEATSDYRLILAANRDEFYSRPTAGASFWKDHPDLLAGRDLEHGGTWMGLTRDGKFSVLTNYRDPSERREGVRSRGRLVSDFLTSRLEPRPYLERVGAEASEYNGFNLLAGEISPARFELRYFPSRAPSASHKLESGVYALSNHLLNTPWPKVQRVKAGFSAIQNRDQLSQAELATELFAIFADRRWASDSELPETGVGLDWERLLSPPFIVSPTYGTRSSAVLLVSNSGRIDFYERSFGPGGLLMGEQSYSIKI